MLPCHSPSDADLRPREQPSPFPPTCLHVCSEAIHTEVSAFSHGWGKAWEGLPLGREWRLCWVPSPAKATLIRRRLHVITAHAAPALSFLGKVCRAGGVRFMRHGGKGVFVRPLRLHVVPQKASVRWSRNLTLGFGFAGLSHCTPEPLAWQSSGFWCNCQTWGMILYPQGYLSCCAESEAPDTTWVGLSYSHRHRQAPSPPSGLVTPPGFAPCVQHSK